jgi:nicotinamidase/pyrazinamidase
MTGRPGLAGYLRERGVTHVWLAGLATDFCVHYSALDAVAHGFTATVLLDACRAIDLNGSLDAAFAEMRDAGIRSASTSELV